MAATVIVNDLDVIQRKLAESGPAVSKAMNAGLRDAAEPVSHTAEQLSLRQIRRMSRSPAWAVTRIGVTRRAVYIVPKERGVGKGHHDDPRRRPNLVGLMMDRSFDPALELGAHVVEERVNLLLGTVTRAI